MDIKNIEVLKIWRGLSISGFKAVTVETVLNMLPDIPGKLNCKYHKRMRAAIVLQKMTDAGIVKRTTEENIKQMFWTGKNTKKYKTSVVHTFWLV